MARSHARIQTAIWGDKDFKARSGPAQLAYFMLTSQPDLGHSGLLSLTVRRWAGLSSDGTKESIWDAITELADSNFVVVDEDTEELLIRSLVRNDNAWKQPKVLSVAITEAARIASPKLRARFCDEMKRIDPRGLPDKTREDVEALLKELPESLANAHLELPAEAPADPPPDPPEEDPANPPIEGGVEGDRGTRARGHVPQPLPHSPAVPPPAADADAPPAAGLFLIVADDSAPQPEVTAGTILGEYIDRCAKRPPDRVIGQLSKEIKKMLDQSDPIDPDDIRRGMAAWMSKGIHPSALASVVNDVMNAGPPSRPGFVDGTGARAKLPTPEEIANVSVEEMFRSG